MANTCDPSYRPKRVYFWINKGSLSKRANERTKMNGPAITICEIDNEVNETLLSLLKKGFPIIKEIVLVQIK